MAVYVGDAGIEQRLKAEREVSGADRYDEVWEGVCFIPPLANLEHQALAANLGGVLHPFVKWPEEGTIYVGVNVSDREADWTSNYRIPDVAVVLKGGLARDCNTHLWGGPRLVVEIVSSGDRSREKLEFYGQIGVRELLLINRDPWSLELFQNQDKELVLIGESSLEHPAPLASAVLPLSFRLHSGKERPLIEVTHRQGTERWQA